MAPPLSPRARFQELKANLSGHKRIVETSAFEQAADTALLEVQRQICSDSKIGPSEGFWKIQGAQLFLDVFRKLSDQPRKPAPIADPNLNHAI